MLFFGSSETFQRLQKDSSLTRSLSVDQQNGVATVTRTLNSGALEPEGHDKLAERVREILLRMHVSAVPGYRKLIEEVGLPYAGAPSHSPPISHHAPRTNTGPRSQQVHQPWKAQSASFAAYPYDYGASGYPSMPPPGSFSQALPYPTQYAGYPYYGGGHQGPVPPFYGAPFMGGSSGPGPSPSPGVSLPGTSVPTASNSAVSYSADSIGTPLGAGFHPFSPLGSPTITSRYFTPSAALSNNGPGF